MSLREKIKSVSALKLNLFANFVGNGWAAAVQLICIPLYIKFMGVEAYGLIGFYVLVQSMVQILDLGLSPTINREMARYSVQPENASEAHDLVRTLETGYWLIGVVIGAAILAASAWIATHWIKSNQIPTRDITRAVMLMGILSVFQWPISFYQGGLMGLGRQVLYNSVAISFSTISNVGAVLILWLASPTVSAFFLWLTATNALKVACLAICLRKTMPRAQRPPRFDLVRIQNIGGFAAGMSGVAVCSLILSQSDKLILSKLLNLKVFGYYCLAGTLGTGLSMIVTAVFNTIFPRFSALAAAGNEEGLRHAYHRWTQLTALLILPVAAVLALSATQILQLWTRNPDVARHAGPIAALLVIGSALNGLTTIPYALQLAYGWVSITLRLAVSMVIITVPALWFLASSYGVLGAAAVWAGMNAVNMLLNVPLTHRRLLRGAAWQWWVDVSLPLVPVLVIALVGRGFVGLTMSPPAAVGALLLVLLCASTAAALVLPSIRPWLLDMVWRRRLIKAL
jgi:O-antigen/teichoic acid export membrane protein